MKLKLLAIDQAYNHSGFAFFEDGEHIEHGSYIVDKDDNKEVKYEKFIENLIYLVHHYQPDYVITEKAWLGPNARVYSLISELVGIMRCYCFLNDINFEVVPVATYRSKLGIRNKKQAIVEYITKSYPDLTFENDDESDAIALGLGYTIILNEQKNDLGENNG